MLSHGILSFSMRPVCYINPATEIYFLTSLSIGFEVIYKNPLQVSEYFQSQVSYILSNTNYSSTQLKVLLNWSKITTFVFPYITSSVESISKVLSARRKHFEEMMPFDSSSSFNVRCYKLWLETFFIMFMF